jgi:hypothetical protein
VDTDIAHGRLGEAATAAQLPLYYVFDNLDLLAPHDALGLGQEGPRTTAGSGTAYLLVPAARALAFDQVFGRPEGLMAA